MIGCLKSVSVIDDSTLGVEGGCLPWGSRIEFVGNRVSKTLALSSDKRVFMPLSFVRSGNEDIVKLVPYDVTSDQKNFELFGVFTNLFWIPSSYLFFVRFVYVDMIVRNLMDPSIENRLFFRKTIIKVTYFFPIGRVVMPHLTRNSPICGYCLNQA